MSHTTIYVPRAQFMSLEYSLCPYSALCVPRVSLCSHSKVYIPTLKFMTPQYSLCPYSTAYILRVQCESLENSVCP